MTSLPFNQLYATRYGYMIAHEHDLYVGQSIKLFGEFSPDEMDLYRALLQPGDVVLEAGANIGALTVPLAQAVHPGLVLAFEPQRLTYQVLCGNCALNSLLNVQALNVALGAAIGQTHVPSMQLTSLDNVGACELDASKPPNIAVDCVDTYDLPRLDLLKLDVEGMEYDILRGAEGTVTRCRPLIVAEIDREAKKPLVLRWLWDHGYTLYAHSPPLYRASNWRGVEVNPWPGVVSFNVLAVPSEEAQPEAEMVARFALEPMYDLPLPVEDAA